MTALGEGDELKNWITKQRVKTSKGLLKHPVSPNGVLLILEL